MFVSLSIIVNSFFLIGAPHVEYEMSDFKKSQLNLPMRTGHQAAVQQSEPYLENEFPQSVDR